MLKQKNKGKETGKGRSVRVNGFYFAKATSNIAAMKILFQTLQ